MHFTFFFTFPCDFGILECSNHLSDFCLTEVIPPAFQMSHRFTYMSLCAFFKILFNLSSVFFTKSFDHDSMDLFSRLRGRSASRTPFIISHFTFCSNEPPIQTHFPFLFTFPCDFGILQCSNHLSDFCLTEVIPQAFQMSHRFPNMSLCAFFKILFNLSSVFFSKCFDHDSMDLFSRLRSGSASRTPFIIPHFTFSSDEPPIQTHFPFLFTFPGDFGILQCSNHLSDFCLTE